jgi:hypothetical protein
VPAVATKFTCHAFQKWGNQIEVTARN